jgi:hypothetical protein
MKILLINFFGSLFVVVAHGPGPLSRRLAALKTWPSNQKSILGQ